MRKTTVKEVKKWFKTLEENRYKKTYASDARRVSWLVNNNLSEDYEAMPMSMRKKWSKAAYGRERQLAREFLKTKWRKAKLKEIFSVKGYKDRIILRESIKKIVGGLINEQKLTEVKKIKYKKNDWKKYNKLVNKGKSVMVQTSFGDHFAWEEGSNYGVFATEKSGREIELSHDDIEQVEIY